MVQPPDVKRALKTLATVAATPFSQADTIPPILYSSEEVHRLEKERIFAREWLCPGLAADLPNPGDYITFSINDQPVLTLRGEDGVVRSFSNVCLHRMMPLVEGRGSCGRKLVCPYHAWTYDPQGKVIGAGHMGGRDPAFDKKQYRLPEIRTEIWEGWVYVTLNPEAPSVASLLAPLLPVVANYGMEGYIPVIHQDHTWATNWKLLNENFMEALGLENPIIIGCSMGGNMVLELGARRPNFYAGIVSCEGADYTPTVSPFFLEMLNLNAPQILECWSQSLTGYRTPADRAREVVWQIIRIAPEYAAGDLTGYAGFDKRDVVGTIKAPVLLLRGDADWLVPQAMVEETSSRIPGSRVEVLAGTGHYPMIENPVEFNQAIRSFADSLTK